MRTIGDRHNAHNRSNSHWRLYRACLTLAAISDDETADRLLTAATKMRRDCCLDLRSEDLARYDLGASIRAGERASEALREAGGACLLYEQCPCGFTVAGDEVQSGILMEEHMLFCNHADLEPRRAAA